MADYRFIEYSSAGGLATIAISRPPYNVLDIPTMEELNRALDVVVDDGSARLLLFTGVGDKAFSAGVEVADHTPDKVARMLEVFHGIFRRLHKMPLPVVAALNGVALGGGCELALACDMIVAAAHAKLGQPEIKLGVFPPVAAVLVPRLMPVAKAMEFLLGGANMSMEEAERLGVVNKVFAKDEFAAGVHAFLESYLSLSRPALLYCKQAIRQAQGKSFVAALSGAEEVYLKQLMPTDDAMEGLAAFMEKRKPVWRHQ